MRQGRREARARLQACRGLFWSPSKACQEATESFKQAGDMV